MARVKSKSLLRCICFFFCPEFSRSQNPHPLPQVIPVLYNEALSKIPEGLIMASLGNALQELHRDRSATQLRLEKLNQ
jgi:hypothetical protein